MIPSTKPASVSKTQEVASPRCRKSFQFHRSDTPNIDECGFESYSLKCNACGSALIGIIDPANDGLILTIKNVHGVV